MSKRIVDEEDLVSLSNSSTLVLLFSAIASIKLIILSLTNPHALYPNWLDGIFNFLLLFCALIVVLILSISIRISLFLCFRKFPLELTTDEKIEERKKQIELAEKERQEKELQEELLNKQIHLAELDLRLKSIKEGKEIKEKEEDGFLQNVQRQIESALNISEANKMLDDAEKERPELSEYLQVIRDSMRDQFYEKK